jgi:hypothetical protein
VFLPRLVHELGEGQDLAVDGVDVHEVLRLAAVVESRQLVCGDVQEVVHLDAQLRHEATGLESEGRVQGEVHLHQLAPGEGQEALQEAPGEPPELDGRAEIGGHLRHDRRDTRNGSRAFGEEVQVVGVPVLEVERGERGAAGQEELRTQRRPRDAANDRALTFGEDLHRGAPGRRTTPRTPGCGGG